MEFLIGLFVGIGLFILAAILLYIGYRLGNKPKAKVEKLEPEQINHQKQLAKDFQAMMNYDTSTALARRDSE